MEGLAGLAGTKGDDYEVEKDINHDKLSNLDNEWKITSDLQLKDQVRDIRLNAGQSRRIWEELYKVLDSSDVVCMVLDARNPIGTISQHVVKHLKKNCPYKHLVYILNKCDLVPTSVTKGWIAHLSKDYPTIAYRAHVEKPFGRYSLLQLLRQYDNFHKDKKTVSVGFIGYPNVGKSSVINAMKAKKVCTAAPIPGQTRVWQYVHLTKRLYLIDCPGVVYNQEADDEIDLVLKGVVRTERLMDPDYYIQSLLDQTKTADIENKYKVRGWKSAEDFLILVAKKMGKLLKGGEADIMCVAKKILFEWQRGEIPYYNLPPGVTEEDVIKGELDGDKLEEVEIPEEDIFGEEE